MDSADALLIEGFEARAKALYARLSAAAATASGDALVRTLCRYPADAGAGLWLSLLMKGRMAGRGRGHSIGDLSARICLCDDAHMAILSTRAPPDVGKADSLEFAVRGGGHFPPLPSAEQLSRRFCHVARYLMESTSLGAAPMGGASGAASAARSLPVAPNAGDRLFQRLSIVAAATAADALRHHPQTDVARRYAEDLCGLICWRLQRDGCLRKEEEKRESLEGAFVRKEAKCLARVLQTLVAVGAAIPLDLLQHLAPRLWCLGGRDVLSVLRLLPPAPIDTALRHQLARAVDLRFRDLKSWRQLRELRELCATLQLEVDEDIAERVASVPLYQAADEEEDIPTVADAMADTEEAEQTDTAGQQGSCSG
ncbi:hypothetical protein cyc_00585 [Cyclospora cayetanensis]|uniref:Uncharacterized protein n=1 Tax=Cyclospora cayetanensis TaxID=88456 RepID=A0A1D3CYP9_9EIME|nr:hypothetical protein cyc_00585 [Cyclospora cayetanensis]